jgi:nucleoside-diphosphate-sugar epimerase
LLPGAARLAESQVADDRAMREALGWQPPFSFEEGLRLTAQWYRTQGG